MKILILEDDTEKLGEIVKAIDSLEFDITHIACSYFCDFNAEINRNTFDLVVADLMVPAFKDSDEAIDVSSNVIESIRDLNCQNYGTPVIALTKYDQLAEDHFSNLNKFDITVVTYEEGSSDWKNSFVRKVESCVPKKAYDFVIVCALEKEADSYLEAGYDAGNLFSVHGISCREISIGDGAGLIVMPPRMGLVNSAILCSRAIDIFNPRIICMSGICAGISGKANIYDVVIPDVCHQHDSGKWTSDGFIPELYSVQLHHQTRLKISEIIKDDDFIEALKKDVTLKRNEFPGEAEELEFKVIMAPTSSGSAVVADDSMLENIQDQHRKMTAFEMESYALYESARQSLKSPVFFSAKSVVDNGDSQKGDEYHRVASLISAKAVYEIIKRGVNTER